MEERNLVGVRLDNSLWIKGAWRFQRTSDIDLAVSGGDFCRFALDVDEET